ncbi:hypothetical protein DFH06DRAFT_1321798 [Mycena polygramma]|nr:hypothetical protein DFH06DRAFT_1321798 [Mycena polygramma]
MNIILRQASLRALNLSSIPTLLLRHPRLVEVLLQALAAVSRCNELLRFATLGTTTPEVLVAHVAVLAQFARFALDAFEHKSDVLTAFYSKTLLMVPTHPLDVRRQQYQLGGVGQSARQSPRAQDVQKSELAPATKENALEIAIPVLKMHGQQGGFFIAESGEDHVLSAAPGDGVSVTSVRHPYLCTSRTVTHALAPSTFRLSAAHRRPLSTAVRAIFLDIPPPQATMSTGPGVNTTAIHQQTGQMQRPEERKEILERRYAYIAREVGMCARYVCATSLRRNRSGSVRDDADGRNATAATRARSAFTLSSHPLPTPLKPLADTGSRDAAAGKRRAPSNDPAPQPGYISLGKSQRRSALVHATSPSPHFQAVSPAPGLTLAVLYTSEPPPAQVRSQLFFFSPTRELRAPTIGGGRSIWSMRTLRVRFARLGYRASLAAAPSQMPPLIEQHTHAHALADSDTSPSTSRERVGISGENPPGGTPRRLHRAAHTLRVPASTCNGTNNAYRCPQLCIQTPNPDSKNFRRPAASTALSLPPSSEQEGYGWMFLLTSSPSMLNSHICPRTVTVPLIEYTVGLLASCYALSRIPIPTPPPVSIPHNLGH